MAKSLLCGLIGADIQKSLAPALQEEEARQQGIRLHYQLIDLAAAGVGVEALPGLIDAVRVMKFAGLNITFPCKQAVIPLLDGLSDEARAIGAVNAVVREGDRLVGYNTDSPGWGWGFKRVLPQGRPVARGAPRRGRRRRRGGVCRAGPGGCQLSIFDADPSRAAALASHLGSRFPDRKTFKYRIWRPP